MSIGAKMFSGIVWSAVERVSVQVVQFVLGIILARILTPNEYGILGILLVFIVISNVFIDSGFTKALIQKKERSTADISTVFWFNIFISIICYLLLWFAAPHVAIFYEDDQLASFLRVLSLSLIINAFVAVPMTLLTIDLNFKAIAKINLVSTVISGGVAIFLAYDGYGVWALIAQTVLRSIFALILIWFWSKWKPIWLFSKSSLKELFSFGSNLLVSSLLNVTVNNFYTLVIGKMLSTKELGYYTRGTQFTDVVYSLISSVLSSVLLPGLSKIQDQRLILINRTRQIIKATAILVVPLFLFLGIIAEPLIKILLTEKWLPAAPIMQIFCFARLITIISGINVNLLYVIGRTDLALKQQYLKLIIRVVFLVIALKYGIIYIALAELTSTILHFFINTYYPGKIMKYGAFQQLKDLKMIILASLTMSLSVLLVTYFVKDDLWKLVFATLTGLSIYYIMITLLKIPEYKIILNHFRGFLNKEN